MPSEVRTGYIKVYRKVQDTTVFKDARAWQLFSFCLLSAKFKKDKDLDIGEFKTTQKDIADALNTTRQSVSKFLEILKKENCIDYYTSNKDTIIRVLNFKKYQSKKDD